MPFDLVRSATPAQFIHDALPFLMEEEAGECLMTGLLWSVRDDPNRLETSYLALVQEDGRIVSAAMRTQIKLLLSRSTNLEAILLLAEDVGRRLLDLDSVLGPAPEVDVFTESWRRQTGREARVTRRERIYRLEELRPIVGVPGYLRAAGPSDRDLLVRWTEWFSQETGVRDAHEGAEAMIDDRLRRGNLFVWEDSRVVSMAATSGETPNGARVSLVYTPPEYRRRGYASAVTAAVSRQVLERGKRWCFLYTDLANPTSNHIYQEIGYRPVCDATDYELAP